MLLNDIIYFISKFKIILYIYFYKIKIIQKCKKNWNVFSIYYKCDAVIPIYVIRLPNTQYNQDVKQQQ